MGLISLPASSPSPSNLFDLIGLLNEAVDGLGSSSYTSGTKLGTVTNDVNGIVIEFSDSATGQSTQLIISENQATISYDNGSGTVGVLNIDAVQIEHSWTNGVNGGSNIINATKNEVTHTLLVDIDAPEIAMTDAPVGNVGVASGELYFDTAANALANSDLICIRKV